MHWSGFGVVALMLLGSLAWGQVCNQSYQCQLRPRLGAFAVCKGGQCQCEFGFTGNPCNCTGGGRRISYLNGTAMCLATKECNFDFECSPPLQISVTGRCMPSPSTSRPFRGFCLEAGSNLVVPCANSWECRGLFGATTGCKNGTCACNQGFSTCVQGQATCTPGVLPPQCGDCNLGQSVYVDGGLNCLATGQCYTDNECRPWETNTVCVKAPLQVFGTCTRRTT